MENLNIIANIVKQGVVDNPDLDVLTFEDKGIAEVRTYKDLWENGQRIAAAFKRQGLKQGDRVALLMQNHPEFVEAMVAAAIIGVVLVPIDPRTRGDKLTFMLNDASCMGIICADYALDTMLSCSAKVSSLVFGFVVGDDWSITNSPLTLISMRSVLDAEDLNLPVVVTDDLTPMQIIYTSGTTGDPKGIIVRHGRFGFVSQQGKQVFGYRDDDRLYTGLSLTHGNAQFLTLAPALKMGLRSVISRKFTKSRLWDITRQYGCTVFALLGGMVTAIYSEPQLESDCDNPVRLVISAGMPEALWSDFSKRYGVDIFEFYGAMEGGMTINPPGIGPVGSCGKAPPSLIAKVIDDTGDEVAPGTPGEILFRPADGSPVTVEYFNNAAASESKTQGGWLHSGDIVTMDADGWVFYLYRAGGGLRHNGDFINPAFIEKVISEHPQVSDLAVYGVPSSSGAPGESDVVVAIVPDEIENFNAQSILEWCSGRLENNMIPEYVHVIEELPKTASEKIQSRFLVDMFEKNIGHIYRA